jgi:predicted GNAT superfamily acetyltransferase
MSRGSLLTATPAFQGIVDRARVAVHSAEATAGVSIILLKDNGQIRDASEVWRRVWDRVGDPVVTPEVLRALSHSGNYVSGAYRDDLMIGALLGFYGGEHGVDHVHSHVLGVDPTTRARGVGFALKQHQRLWALERGLDRIEWTYDPLVRNNGFFNINKLGCRGVEYFVDFYGEMPDGINSGDKSDRVLVSWDLERPGVEAAAAGDSAADGIVVREWVKAGGTVALEVGDDEGPVVRADPVGDIVLCQVPADIVAIRHRDPARAHLWRTTIRGVLDDTISRGLRITGMSRDGYYLLTSTR